MLTKVLLSLAAAWTSEMYVFTFFSCRIKTRKDNMKPKNQIKQEEVVAHLEIFSIWLNIIDETSNIS